MAANPLICLGLAVVGGLLALSAHAQDAPDPKDLSKAFWSDWKAEKSSPAVAGLRATAGCGDQVAKARQIGSGDVQHVADLAISNPSEAAKIIAAGRAASNTPEASAAVQAVLGMRASKQVLAQAVAAAPPAERRASARFTANLSTGVSGLPGVYLSDQPHPARDPAPTGYQPVAGGSRSCPSR
jgi:hypothetical protein